MATLFAFLHHLAAFTLVAALVSESILIQDDLTVRSGQKIQLADIVFGVSAGAVFVVGILRVLYFEQGTSYYSHSVPFLAKLSLFLMIGLLSIYPTREFLSWRRPVKQGEAPTVTDRKMHAIRSIIHCELVGVVLIILCAAHMAKGVGYLP
jgi:putative membrane protein